MSASMEFVGIQAYSIRAKPFTAYKYANHNEIWVD